VRWNEAARRAPKVEEARLHRDEVARRCSESQLPGAQWSDDTVRHAAARAAREPVAPAVQEQMTKAAQAEKEATGFQETMRYWDGRYDAALRTNEHNADRRRARRHCGTRPGCPRKRPASAAELVAEMTPEEVAEVDAARDALLEQPTRSAGGREHSREDAWMEYDGSDVHPEYEPPTHHIDLDGPVLEL